MTLNFIELLEKFAFPIVMCVILCAYIYYQGNLHKKEVDALRLSLETTNEGVAKAMNELSSVVRLLQLTLKERGYVEDENN